MSSKKSWIAAIGTAILVLSGFALEIGDHIVFDFSHNGVRGCTLAHTITMVTNVCKEKFAAPSADVSIHLLSFDPKFHEDIWGERSCTVTARVHCQIIGLPE